MPMSKEDCTVWAAVFGLTNHGMPMPSAYEMRMYRSNAKHGASLQAMVNHVCAQFMESDDHYEMFLDEARSWFKDLQDQELEYIFNTWPGKREVWEASEVPA